MERLSWLMQDSIRLQYLGCLSYTKENDGSIDLACSQACVHVYTHTYTHTTFFLPSLWQKNADGLEQMVIDSFPIFLFNNWWDLFLFYISTHTWTMSDFCWPNLQPACCNGTAFKAFKIVFAEWKDCWSFWIIWIIDWCYQSFNIVWSTRIALILFQLCSDLNSKGMYSEILNSLLPHNLTIWRHINFDLLGNTLLKLACAALN